MATRAYNYVTSSSNWSRELAVVFGAGFAAASLLWLGLWFFQARPAQAGALEAQASELQQAQTSLAACESKAALLAEDKEMLETEVKQLDTMLKQAWRAASRRTSAKPEAASNLGAEN